MKKFAAFLILFFSIQLIAFGQEIFRSENQAAVKINQYFTELTKQEKFNGTVLVALDNYKMFMTVEGGIRLETVRLK